MKPGRLHPIQRWKYVNRRNAAMKKLAEYITRVHQEQHKGTTKRRDQDEANRIFNGITEVEQNQFAYLQQEDVLESLKRRGVTIPEQYLITKWPLLPLLTPDGQRWASRALRDALRSDVEAWGRALGPYMAALTAGFSAIAAIMSALAAWTALRHR